MFGAAAKQKGKRNRCSATRPWVQRVHRALDCSQNATTRQGVADRRVDDTCPDSDGWPAGCVLEESAPSLFDAAVREKGNDGHVIAVSTEEPWEELLAAGEKRSAGVDATSAPTGERRAENEVGRAEKPSAPRNVIKNDDDELERLGHAVDDARWIKQNRALGWDAEQAPSETEAQGAEPSRSCRIKLPHQ